jgi:tetratricopeptide (TPR) repeat protein
MTASKGTDGARRYFVDDLPGATIPASRLRGILDRLEEGRPLSAPGFDYLRRQGLDALARFARGEVAYEAFRDIAGGEQATRRQRGEAVRQAEEASMRARQAEQQARMAEQAARQEAARLARERDPKYIAKMKNQALRERYDIDLFIEPQHFAQLMGILRRFDAGQRLTDDDVLWMRTDGRNYFSTVLQRDHHAREAEHFAAEYGRTADAWLAVNASAHYRKCEQAGRAHDLLVSIPAHRQTTRKLRSAIATTHGGAMRDLRRLDEALNLGHQAHALTPNDYRPCTLLGAVNFELGDYDAGRGWYDKALERGATERSIDQDLRFIFHRADAARRDKIRAFLLREDPVRYRWVNEPHGGKPRSSRPTTSGRGSRT